MHPLTVVDILKIHELQDMIFAYLDLQNLISLARTCTDLRDIVYRQKLWKNTIICLSEVTESTALSIRDRGIDTLSLDVGFFDKATIKNCKLASSIKTLVLGSTQLNFLFNTEEFHYEGLESLNVIHKIYSDEYTSMTEEGLFSALPVFIGLRQLHIYLPEYVVTSYNFRIDSICYNLPCLKHLEFTYPCTYWRRSIHWTCICSTDEGKGIIELTVDYPMDESGKLPTYMPNKILRNMELLAGVSLRKFQSLADMKIFATGLQSLKHLRIDQLDRWPRSDFWPQAKTTIQHPLESLVITNLTPIMWRQFLGLLSLFPNLKALAIKFFPRQYQSYRDREPPRRYVYDKCQFALLLTMCSKLSVLQMEGFD